MGYFLPNKYKELHNLCFYLHDILVQIVVEGENKKLFDTIYSLKKGSDIEAIKGNVDCY